MGWWTLGFLPKTKEDIVAHEFRFETEHKVLRIEGSISTIYLAVEFRGEVYGMVIMSRKDGKYDRAVRCLIEIEGPIYYRASKKLISMLSPTEDANALKWRKKCLESKKSPPTIKPNVLYKTIEPQKFTNGNTYEYFMVVGRRTYAADATGKICSRVIFKLKNFEHIQVEPEQI